jgi:short-subunit dehydrogenase
MPYALITGATKGIGKAIAHELAKKKYNLLLVARSEDLLKSNCKEFSDHHGINCSYLPLDLSANDAADKVFEWIQKNNFDVKVLVNNAGYGLWGAFEKSDLTEQLNMMQLNMQTMTSLTYKMLPILHKHSQAFILNVASTAAYQAVPTLAVYAGCKSYVVLFTRGLRAELKNSNISVTCLSPGTTDTNFMDRARMDLLKERAAKFSMKVEDVARIAVTGMLSGKSEIIPGFVNWISVNLTYLVPKVLTEKIAGDLYKVKK